VCSSDLANFSGLDYNFSDTITMADPGAGNLRLNHATPASVTILAFDDTSAATGNPDVSAFLLTFDDSTNTVKGTITIKKAVALENFAIYSLASLVDEAGWVRFVVTYVDGSGSFTDADALVVEFTRAGDDGADGADGDDGNDGAAGSTGAAGSDGVNAGLTFDFSTTTSMADPGAGNVRFDNATLASVANIAIDDLSSLTGNPDESGMAKLNEVVEGCPRRMTLTIFSVIQSQAKRPRESTIAENHVG